MDDHYSAVLAELEHELAADAMAVAEGVYARVTLADRLRAAVGGQIEIGFAARPAVTGRVADVTADAVLLNNGACRVVRLAAVETVDGLPDGHRTVLSPGPDRRSFATLLRPWAGHLIGLGLVAGTRHGRLERVGADHLQLRSQSKSEVVAFAALDWVTGPALDQ